MECPVLLLIVGGMSEDSRKCLPKNSIPESPVKPIDIGMHKFFVEEYQINSMNELASSLRNCWLGWQFTECIFVDTFKQVVKLGHISTALCEE